LIPAFSRDFFCFFLKNNKINISNAPIGIFDSGLGGLSICKEIVDLLPNESIIYLADSANTPYGEKTKEEIVQLCIKNTEYLLTLGCKMIVVACNTATTNSITVLRDMFDVSFIGLEPATKPAALQTKTGKIGVLATKGTLNSDLFLTTSSKYRGHLKIVEAEGINLVRLIEKGDLEATIPLLKQYLLPMIEEEVDNIVLGCTHYPFLIPFIKDIIPQNVAIIDSGKAVAKQTLNVLRSEGLLNSSVSEVTRFFYTNGKQELLKAFLKKIELPSNSVSFKYF
jgi:glutamate racemase